MAFVARLCSALVVCLIWLVAAQASTATAQTWHVIPVPGEVQAQQFTPDGYVDLRPLISASGVSESDLFSSGYMGGVLSGDSFYPFLDVAGSHVSLVPEGILKPGQAIMFMPGADAPAGGLQLSIQTISALPAQRSVSQGWSALTFDGSNVHPDINALIKVGGGNRVQTWFRGENGNSLDTSSLKGSALFTYFSDAVTDWNFGTISQPGTPNDGTGTAAPSLLGISGRIGLGSESVSPEIGDLVVASHRGTLLAQGKVYTTEGDYFIFSSKTQDYNGSAIFLSLVKESGSYELTFGPDNQFTYNGGFPFPSVTTINPSVGKFIGGSGGGSGTVPSNLQIVGNISPTNLLSEARPQAGDQILVIADGETEGSGTVLDANGSYYIDMSKSSQFNGTTATLHFRNTTGTYQMLFEPGNQFVFKGGFPFPERISINATVGGRVDDNSGKAPVDCANEIDKPFTFVPGSNISSQQMNENFDRLYEAYNELIQCLK